MNLDLPEVIFLTGEARGHFVCRHLGLTRVHAELIELVHSKNKKHLDLDSNCKAPFHSKLSFSAG